MIEVKNIRKSFGDKVVIDGVSATMEPGKNNLIIGASGSGKTVLMKCMIGLVKPDAGQILYEGKDILTLDKNELKVIRQEIGMLFQGSALFDSMSVERNVKFPLDMFTKKTHAEKMKRVNEVLERVNLNGANKKFPSEISGGMKKRVALARALVLNPKYLFCDEPNSGLDPITSRLIDDLIKELTAEYNITTIINTHDMKSLFEMGDNIIFIYKGKKSWEGQKGDIKTSGNEQLLSFMKASEF